MFLSPGICRISFKPLGASLRACSSLVIHGVLPSPFADSPKCARKQRQTLCSRHILSPLVHEHGVQLKTQPSDNRPVSRNTLECGYVNKSNSMVQLKAVIKVEPIKNIAWRVLPAPKTIGNVTVMNNLINHTLCPTSTEHSATYSWAYLII